MAEAFQPKFVDLVRNYTTTVGTGDFKLGPVVNGYTGFAAACQAGDSFYYSAIGVDKPVEREVGRGTLLADGTISRDPIDGIKTSFTSGTKSIGLIAAAEWFEAAHALVGSITPFGRSLTAAPAAADARATLGLGAASLLASDADPDLASNSDSKLPTQKAVRAYVDGHGGQGTTAVADRTALSLTGSQALLVLLREDRREGTFLFDDSDLSAAVAADTAQGVYVPPASDPTGASGAWVRKFDGPLNLKWFGATGTGDEALFATNYQSDITSTPVTILQQTRDGLAINSALKLLRLLGGGELFVPPGTFTTYGYLERIDFPLKLRGAGRGIATIRNCATSPWADGYGVFCIYPAALSEISISGLSVSGHATSRAGAAGEKRAYPIAVYGLPKLTLLDVESRNSPIDCFYTNYTNGEVGAYVQATNCLFSNSWRNTCSLISGWNQQYTACILEKGGKVGAGTNPKAVLDIEPNSSAAAIKNITFDNCIFREAVNSVVSGVWAGNVRFNGCTMDAFGGALAAGAGYGFPILTNMQAGEFTFSGCTLKYTNGDYRGTLLGANSVYTGDYGASQFVRYEGCAIEGAGTDCYGLNTQFRDCTFKNSLRPFLAGGNNTQNLFIDGLTLTNVFDPTTINAGGGAYSSFFLQSSFEGVAVISNLTVRVDAPVLPADFLATLSGTTRAYGILLNGSATGKIRLLNVHAEGYYRKLVTAIGGTLNASNFRDWNVPNLPPADTAGQTTNASTYFYRSCTGYGDAA